MSDLAPMEYTPHQKEIMLDTVAKGCKPEQFMLMMELANKYKLDPFARQIWATPMGIIIGRDGFLKLAHDSGNFDGMETTFEERDGKLYSATTTVWHKKMSHPIKFTAYLSEFYKEQLPGKQPGAWQKMPYVMLQKCSESHALRRTFCITGLYDEAELSDNPEEVSENPPVMEYVDADFKVNEEPESIASEPEPVPETEEQPEQKTGFCSCGCDSMPDELRGKFNRAFNDNFGKQLPPDICEKCARDWWSQLMEEKKKKDFGGA